MTPGTRLGPYEIVAAITYAVTELLHGETLRDRLAQRGALSPKKAIDIAVRIARGRPLRFDRHERQSVGGRRPLLDVLVSEDVVDAVRRLAGEMI